tara:strand:+ start:67 stop:471 length:405 start_codon:yes stop_codon:yes gene_type:complete
MAIKTRDFLKKENRDFNNILDSVQTQADHLRHEGTVPTLTVTTAGNGTCAIDAASTDVAGELTFANTWADGDTVVVNFNKAYATAPQVILSNIYNGSGAALIEFDLVTRAADKFTITASGTAAGKISYFVIETV